MGAAAGLAGRIGVLSGVSAAAMLAPHADAVIATVDDLLCKL